MALVENIQREDLNAIEVALAYQQLMDQNNMTQEKVSERVGKSRAAVANHLRLLRLPAQIQLSLQKHELDMGHARALLSLDSPSMQIKVYKEILKNGYSVRKVEEIVNDLKNGDDVQAGGKTIKAGGSSLPAEYEALKRRIADVIGTKVQMTCSPKGKGKITIAFNDEDELVRIMEVLDRAR